MAPPAPVLETVTRIEEAPSTTTSAVIGADLLGTAAYDLPVVANLSVRNELEFLIHERHAVVGGWMRNAAPYHEWVRDVFASHGVPRDLSHLGMIESGYRPTVRSHAGAVGMWQFMPTTGRGMGLRIDTLVDERMDPVRATHAAARHLRYLHRRFNGDWSLAAAAYNAGEGRINRGLGRFGASDFWDLANRGDLAQETRRYVPRLYATTIIAKNPQRFGYPAPGPARRFAFDSVRVDLTTPLSVLAQVGNLPLNELTELNPHLFRQVAPRDYWVWVPAGQGGVLQQAYTASDFRQRGGFGTYRVREGDSLDGLARVSGLTTEQIRSLNLSASTEALRTGTSLRLYADAARVLNARPQARVARAEPARSSRPRVLGDPPETADSATGATSSAGVTRAGSSASPGRSASSGESASERTATSSRAASSSRSESSASERNTSSSRSTPSSRSTSSSRSGSTEGSSSRRTSETAGSSRAAGERASTTSTASTSAERRTGGSASARSHTVGDGETLWGIARRYDVTVDAVRAANEMDSETIRPGQTLRIPRSTSTSTGAAASGTRPQTPSGRSGSTGSSQPARAREHTVGEGETLWGIARRYETTVDSLRRANDLGEDQPIRPGQKLAIPEN